MMKNYLLSAILATLMLFMLAACSDKSVPTEAKLHEADSATTEKEIELTTTSDPNAPKEIDIFEYIEVEYSGIAPEAKAYIDYDIIPYQIGVNAEFELDKKEGLKNGDTITITCTPKKGLLELENLVPISLTKEIVIEGLPEYITDIGKYDLTELEMGLDEYIVTTPKLEDYTTIAVGKDTILYWLKEQDVADTYDLWNTKETCFTLENSYFFNRKDESSEAGKNFYNNFLLNIYRWDVTAAKNGVSQVFTIYVSLCAYDLTSDTENSITYSTLFERVFNITGSIGSNSGYKTELTGWLTSSEQVFEEYEKVFSADYEVTKII